MIINSVFLMRFQAQILHGHPLPEQQNFKAIQIFVLSKDRIRDIYRRKPMN